MKNQANGRNRQNPDTTDQGQLPRRDRSNVEDAPDSAGNQNLGQDRTIGDPRAPGGRRAPGAENAEDELDDEDFESQDASWRENE